jgi:hypothetical protein
MQKYYFSLQKDILEPRYQVQDLVMQSMAPAIPIDSSDLQMRASAALAAYAERQTDPGANDNSDVEGDNARFAARERHKSGVVHQRRRRCN